MTVSAKCFIVHGYAVYVCTEASDHRLMMATPSQCKPCTAREFYKTSTLKDGTLAQPRKQLDVFYSS